MKTIGVLITGIGGDIGQGVIKCLRDAPYRLRIIGCDSDPYAVTRNEVHRFAAVPPVLRGKEYRTFIGDLIRSEKVDYVLPLSEQEIGFFDAERPMYEGRVRLLLNSHDVLETFMDKYKTYGFFKGIGVPVPRTRVLENYEGGISFPAVLKMRHGCGSKGMIVVRNEQELAVQKEAFKEGIIQEMVGTADEEYTMAVFSDGKDVHSISFRRKLGYGSLTRYAELCRDEKLHDIAVKTATALKLDGPINVQLRKHNGEYLPFEVNARISSTVHIRHHFGFTDVCWWIDRYEKRPVQFKLKYASGKAVRKIEEVFFDLDEAK